MELLNLASSSFIIRAFVWMQNGSTVVQQEVDFRGGGPHLGLDVGMELNSLGWVLWRRRAQALKENMRKSALASQNKKMLNKIWPTNSLFEPRISYLFSYLFSRPVRPLPTPAFSLGPSV